MDVTQNSRVNVFINDTQAKKSIPEMEAQVRKLRSEWLRTAAGTKEYFDKLEEIDAVKQKLNLHKDQVKNIGTAWKNVSDNVERAASRTNNMNSKLAEGSGGWSKMTKGVDDFNVASPRAITNIEKSTVAMKKGSSIWAQIGKQALMFGTMALGYLGVTTLFSKIGQGLQGAAKMSDVMADVQRTTGMTADETERLRTAFSSWDTRTSTLNLLELAKAGGKLGVAEQDIEGFVRAADQINVALGEDLGKDAITAIGKIVNIFHIKDEFGLEEAMLKVGSAINSAGQASEAQEGYIVDFLNRMGGIAPIAKISAQQVIALGATLDSLGQPSETASTALTNLFKKMASDSETYAKFAGMNVKEFVKLMDEDAFEAFVKVLEGANKTSGGLTALTETLGELGLDGGRVTGIFGSLANNTEKLRGQVDLVNKSYEAGTSITTEFTMRNETLGAAMDKLMKRINGYIINSEFTHWLTDVVMKLGDTRTELEKTSQAYEIQKKYTAELEESIKPLIERYTELKEKGELNTDEQTELHDIIQKVADILPTAATEVDEYGNAIDISTEKVQNAILKNKEYVQAMGRKEIAELNKQIYILGEQAKTVQETINSGGTEMDMGIGSGQKAFFPFTEQSKQAELDKLAIYNTERAAALTRLVEEYQTDLSDADQKWLDGFLKQSEKVTKVVNTNQTDLFEDEIERIGKLNEEEEKEAKKRADKYKSESDQLKNFIKNNAQQLGLINLDANEKEIQQIRNKYADEIELAKNHKEQLAIIEQQMQDEIDAKKLEQEQEHLKKVEEIQREIFLALADEETLAIDKITNFYDTLIAKALEAGLAVDELNAARQRALDGFDDQKAAEFGKGMAMGLEAMFAPMKKAADDQAEIDKTAEKTTESLDAQGLAWYNMGASAVASINEETTAAEAFINVMRTQLKALMAQAIAKAIVNALGAGPLGLFTAAAAGFGATLLFDKLIPEFDSGGYTDAATLFIAGEKKPEYVATNTQVTDPVTGPIIKGLDHHRRTGQYASWMTSSGYEPNMRNINGGLNYGRNSTGTAASTTYNNYNTTHQTSDNGELGIVLKDLKKVLGELKETGVAAYIFDKEVVKLNQKTEKLNLLKNNPKY